MALNSPNPAAIVVKGLMDEANQDGKQYARQDGEWAEVAPPSGKNLIINGNLTVDQRQGSDPDFVADRWKVVDASNMTQIIEDVNFEPSTEYTLSWEGGTPQQITSPASGHWTLPNIPRTARKIQLEKGDQATEFEYESYGETLRKCQRYYESFDLQHLISDYLGSYMNEHVISIYYSPKRDLPALSFSGEAMNLQPGGHTQMPVLSPYGSAHKNHASISNGDSESTYPNKSVSTHTYVHIDAEL